MGEQLALCSLRAAGFWVTIQVLFSPCLSSPPVDSARVAGHGPERFALPAAFVFGDAGANVGFAALLLLWFEWYFNGLISGERIWNCKRCVDCVHMLLSEDERQMANEE